MSLEIYTNFVGERERDPSIVLTHHPLSKSQYSSLIAVYLHRYGASLGHLRHRILLSPFILASMA